MVTTYIKRMLWDMLYKFSQMLIVEHIHNIVYNEVKVTGPSWIREAQDWSLWRFLGAPYVEETSFG